MLYNRKKIGLALSGGAVLGIAHLGVIKVLEENDIQFDIIAGTSVGSLVGAFIAAGYSSDKLFEMAKAISWENIGKITIPKMGLLNSKKLENFVNAELGEIDIKDLPKIFAAVGVDLTKGKEVIFTKGPVSEAVRASCSIPGIFTPLIKGDQVIVDGGVLNILPTDVVKNLGAEYIISVKLKPSLSSAKPPQNITQVIINSSMLAWGKLANNATQGDVTITPDLAGLNLHDFKQAERLYERGRIAALQSIKQIKNDWNSSNTLKITLLKK